METRYFRAENANRLIAGVKFEIVDVVAGTPVGILAADEELGAQLGELAKNPAEAVTEITEEQYREALVKKMPNLAQLPHSNPPLSSPSVPIKGAGKAVVQPEGSPRLP